MYTLSNEQLAEVLGTRLSEDDSMGARTAEATVQRSLPYISGLDDAKTEDERNAIYAQTIAQQLSAFVKLNGSPFGAIDDQVVSICEQAAQKETAAEKLIALAA